MTDDLIEQMKASLEGVTDGPWDIDWYICRAESEDVKYERTRKLKKGETRKSLKVGDELWRVPQRIGPIGMDHNHWSGNYLTCSNEDARFFAAARTLLPEAIKEIEELRGKVRSIALDNMAATDQAAENLIRAEAAEAKANIMVADKINLRSELLSVEAKLVKAVEALGRIEVASQNFAQPEMLELACRYAHETTRRLARATLAEIEGETK